MESIKKILVLAPHTDDGEFGCGGTISKFIEIGAEIHYAAFSCAEESVPEGLPKDILEVEVKNATKLLGIKTENLYILKYPVRKLSYHRQEILEDMVILNKNIEPDLVFTPSKFDVHQDHFTITQEAMRAFKFTSLLGYELPWNNYVFETTCFVHLEDRHVANKLESLKCYRSQIGRKYSSEEYIKGLAMTRGVQVGGRYAETFDVIRWIIK
ncbi:MAG: LmbE family protein [Bacteroidetes bacterium RIFOXYA12_FULL_35_11]|nr:MAG: LmbE family protein [Bacteroidetes bacterium GWF2_35_48]OFY77647.1 MAG: LmbE family protein [Bacteroidetes bacterium RIFOXYA12_FULL_35_11]OFY92513.1 MAG: LmbE family protein [Bacteroidetes bacterium RIFOXYB2_FULL_35_7]HBX52998.1 LmbE family protein [Bacteroidales bacterium]